jgi:hypothetical protein
MIGRIASMTGSPDALIQAEQHFLGQGRSHFKNQKGLVSLHIFFDAAQGKAAVVSIWQDAQSAQASFRALAGLRKELSALGVTVTIQHYDVLAE